MQMKSWMALTRPRQWSTVDRAFFLWLQHRCWIIDTARVWNEADQCLPGATLYFTIYNSWKKRVLKYFKANKWLPLCGVYGSWAYRLDYTIACASGPERDREKEKFVSRGERWIFLILPSAQYRHEWISQGENYSKVTIGFFFPHVQMVNGDPKDRNITLLSKSLFSVTFFLPH